MLRIAAFTAGYDDIDHPVLQVIHGMDLEAFLRMDLRQQIKGGDSGFFRGRNGLIDQGCKLGQGELCSIEL